MSDKIDHPAYSRNAAAWLIVEAYAPPDCPSTCTGGAECPSGVSQLTARCLALADQLEAADRKIAWLTSAAESWPKHAASLIAERDSLRKQLEIAERRRVDDIAMWHATESDLAHNHRRADAAEADLALARAALRAILPVYRVVEASYDYVHRPDENGTPFDCECDNCRAVDAARAALTPDITAILAGIEGK